MLHYVCCIAWFVGNIEKLVAHHSKVEAFLYDVIQMLTVTIIIASFSTTKLKWNKRPHEQQKTSEMREMDKKRSRAMIILTDIFRESRFFSSSKECPWGNIQSVNICWMELNGLHICTKLPADHFTLIFTWKYAACAYALSDCVQT